MYVVPCAMFSVVCNVVLCVALYVVPCAVCSVVCNVVLCVALYALLSVCYA